MSARHLVSQHARLPVQLEIRAVKRKSKNENKIKQQPVSGRCLLFGIEELL